MRSTVSNVTSTPCFCSILGRGANGQMHKITLNNGHAERWNADNRHVLFVINKSITTIARVHFLWQAFTLGTIYQMNEDASLMLQLSNNIKTHFLIMLLT